MHDHRRIDDAVVFIVIVQRKLQEQLAAVQMQDAVHLLSERTVIEIVLKLQETKQIEVCGVNAIIPVLMHAVGPQFYTTKSRVPPSLRFVSLSMQHPAKNISLPNSFSARLKTKLLRTLVCCRVNVIVITVVVRSHQML